jgi:hypothetical protein
MHTATHQPEAARDLMGSLPPGSSVGRSGSAPASPLTQLKELDMNTIKSLSAVALASLAIAAPAVYAQGQDPYPNHFVKMCDENKDGMVSKAEAMKMVEKMFDKADTKKAGKLDKKQVEFFLKSLQADTGS